MTEVKFCGMTRAADVEAAVELGVRYLGFNFSSKSPRRIALAQAHVLASGVPRSVQRVGIFVDEEYAAIEEAVETAGLDLVQLHRELRAADLEKIRVPIITVARVVGAAARVPPEAELEKCHAILFDTAVADRPGGSGLRFDWELVAGRRLPVPVFLAGGLTPENVEEAIRRVRPNAVDVATGVESQPGVKAPERMRMFMEAVRRADG